MNVSNRSEEGRSPSKLIPFALILLFLASTGFGFLKSSFFTVEIIETLGLNCVDPNEIINIVNYVKGTNIFDVDLSLLAKKIQAYPRVDKVNIKRKLPSTLILELTERSAVAVLPYSGYFVLVDSNGFAVEITESYRAKDPPLITGIKPQQLLVGKKIEGKGIDYVLSATTMLSSHLLNEISEFNYKDDTGVSIYMQSGTWIVLGLGNIKEYLTRIDILESLLVKLEKENQYASYIDVRFPNRPVIKYSN